MAVSTVLMAVLLAAPSSTSWSGAAEPRWLSAYGVVIAVGAFAAALAVALTVALFRTIGPKRTRLAAQIVAAIVGAAFVIGLQTAAILSYGTLSYFTFLKSDLLYRLCPAIESLLWWPARAMLGDLTALAAVLGGGIAAARRRHRAVLAPRFGDHAIAAAGISDSRRDAAAPARGFRRASPRARCGARNGRCCAAIPGSPRRP